MNYAFTLDSVFLQDGSHYDSGLVRAQQTSMFYSYIVLLIYVNETIFTWKPIFLQDSCQCFTARDDSPCAHVISNCMLGVRGLVPGSEF